MAAEMGIEADAVDTLDNQELIATLPRAIRLINDHISTPANAQHMNSSRRKILLFCETGNGHSALVIIAYLMVMFNLGFPDALQVAHMQRFCIDMDESSKQMLASFESIIEAKRDVEHAKRISSINSKLAIPTKVNKKRDFEGQHDMTNTMDMDIDEGPFLGRRGVAPFQDRSK
ncbi:hypothetical protein EYZ11_006702 [Aspergillus tanneri]|nr:hypothetical protein EYZ11_006702 [Aspergillus tanneri]